MSGARIGAVAVIVPAADEADRIGACLDALRVARDRFRAHSKAPVRIVVVLDGCRDRTAERVAGYPEVEVVAIADRCVGAARGAGSGRVLRTAGAPDGLWLANTDADSTVPPDWLVEMVRLADTGADLVLGTVQPTDELPPALRARWLAQHDPADGHRHVHGANLGVRAGRLVELGGWAELATGEDVDLVARAVVARAAVARTGAIPVRTSARMSGRTPHGFWSYLCALVGEPLGAGGL